MKYNQWICLALCLLLSSTMYANKPITGPSWVSSEMIPVSINKKGEILCKTRYQQNASGAHRFMTVRYGACVVTNGKIVQYEGKILDPGKVGTGAQAYKMMNYYDSIFKMETTPKQFLELLALVDDFYTFSSCNTNSFLVDKKMTIKKFEKKEEIKLAEHPQLALNGATGAYYERSEEVHVLYDFGKLIFLANEIGDGIIIGAEFDYHSQEWENSEGEIIAYDFDFCEVTGVLIKK